MAARFHAFVALIAAACLASLAHTGAARAQQKPNVVKGQAQLAGGNGEFGTIYSLKVFNFEILSARYTLDPYICHGSLYAKTGTKFLVLNIAVKNAYTDNFPFYYPYDLFTLVDSTGQTYGGASLQLASAGLNDFSVTLHPGQGLGQPGLHNALTEGFVIPGNARIVKIIINNARLGRDEKVFRYYIAGATKEEAGEAGDPKNVIAPLPAAARDPSDPSGATLADVAKGTMGVYLPSGLFYLKLNSFTYSTDPIYGGKAPANGKKYAIMNVTAKGVATRISTFDISGGDFPLWSVETTDGDRIKPDGFWKAVSDAAADHTFQPGDEYTFRVFFIVDKAAVVKRAIMAAGNSNKWGFDVSSIH